ncbi:hypothetical protein EV360DRAFT_84453 [Lentinula raphanica]|nr:hypothetical protein EV360DRAFT_84453 [Lentinula raphanica]
MAFQYFLRLLPAILLFGRVYMAPAPYVPIAPKPAPAITSHPSGSVQPGMSISSSSTAPLDSRKVLEIPVFFVAKRKGIPLKDVEYGLSVTWAKGTLSDIDAVGLQIGGSEKGYYATKTTDGKISIISGESVAGNQAVSIGTLRQHPGKPALSSRWKEIEIHSENPGFASQLEFLERAEKVFSWEQLGVEKEFQTFLFGRPAITAQKNFLQDSLRPFTIIRINAGSLYAGFFALKSSSHSTHTLE